MERFRLANGQYPGSLPALVPRFIERIPTDVNNGEPPHYRRTEDGQFVLYSVGWNQKDDGGVVVYNQEKPPTQNDAQGDWVWRYPSQN